MFLFSRALRNNYERLHTVLIVRVIVLIFPIDIFIFYLCAQFYTSDCYMSKYVVFPLCLLLLNHENRL